jgi:hypothetical protein
MYAKKLIRDAQARFVRKNAFVNVFFLLNKFYPRCCNKLQVMRFVIAMK